MPQWLTTNATVLCPHGGKGTTAPSSTKFTIGGGAVAVEGDTGTLACPFGPLPCVGYTLVSMGLNATTIDGRRTILVTDFNRTQTGLPLAMVETHQGLDNSTVVPLPPGGAPLPPELADDNPPAVAALTPALAFSTTAPAPLAASFSLNAPYPLRWVLTLVNEPVGYSLELTKGQPPDVVVTPAGGEWSTPSLVVTVAMSPTFLAGLTPGKSSLYLTAVTKRGVSMYAEAVVTVTP